MNQTKKDTPAIKGYKVMPSGKVFDTLKDVMSYLSKREKRIMDEELSMDPCFRSTRDAYHTLGYLDCYYLNLENPTLEDFEKAPCHFCRSFERIIEIIGEDPETEGQTYENSHYEE